MADAHTNLPAQQERFDAFRAVYNHERPHEALGQHADGVTARPMPSNGRIKRAGELIFVREALVGEPAGILETEGGDWLVRYADVELGYIHPQAPPAQPASTANGEG